jgi:hypothetical protein
MFKVNRVSHLRIMGRWVRVPNWVISVGHSPLFPMAVAMGFVIFVGLAIGTVEHSF